MCSGCILLPRSLQIELCDNPTGPVVYRGGYGEVSKREYEGQEVAVKVLKTYADSDLQKIARVSRGDTSTIHQSSDRNLCRCSAKSS